MAEIVRYVYIFHLTGPQLLNADVLNFYLAQNWIHHSEITQIWCQSEEGMLSRQLSCLEATPRHAQVVPEQVFLCFNRTAPHSIKNTGAFLRKTWEMRRRRRLSACVRVRGTFRA